MAELDISGCDSKAKEIPIVEVNGIGRTLEIDEVNDEGKTQSNASVGSWLIQVKSAFNPPSKIWQVSRKICIYRVIKRMMVSNPENYAPFVISFVPYYHQKNPQLFTMDLYKLEAIHRMLTRLKIDVTSLIGEIQRRESKIRECYAEQIEMDGETLSWMLAIKACFILEFLKSFALTRDESDTDCFSLVFENKDFENSMFGGILDDIMKLENQIPLFVLIALLQLEFGTRTLAIAQLAALLSTYKVFCGFPFSSSLPGNTELGLKKYIEKDPCHLPALYRMMNKNLLSDSNLESASPVEQDSCNGPAHTIDDKRRHYGRWMNMTLPGWMQMQKLGFIDIPSPDESCSILCPKSPDDCRSTLTAELLHGAGIKFQPGKIGF
ncbi:hypothetical protein SUGI_0693530 [Cryptomeria japonica]|nr:hypothetical protein SUGI_0693530 [Cryptomeria japonica]